MLHEQAIGWRERVVPQLVDRDPCDGCVFVHRWLSVDYDVNEMNYVARTGISVVELVMPHGLHLDAEFLGQFSPSGVLKAFAVKEFPAGEFPQTTMSLVRWALTQEVAATSCNDSRHYADRRLRHTLAHASGIVEFVFYQELVHRH